MRSILIALALVSSRRVYSCRDGPRAGEKLDNDRDTRRFRYLYVDHDDSFVLKTWCRLPEQANVSRQ